MSIKSRQKDTQRDLYDDQQPSKTYKDNLSYRHYTQATVHNNVYHRRRKNEKKSVSPKFFDWV
jgi:hypothetical protein